jgi:F-type H+-transporting ATPase subunit b
MDIGEILGKIGFDPSTFFVTIINFLIVFFLLKKFLFDKIGQTLTDRQKAVQKGIEDAQKAGYELSLAEQKSDEIIGEAQKKANSIIEKSWKEATDLAEVEKQKSLDEISKLHEDSAKQLELDRLSMISEIKKEAADLAILATEKIIEKELDHDHDRKIIDKYLKDLGENEGNKSK